MSEAGACLVCQGPTVELGYFLPQHPQLTLPVRLCLGCGKRLIDLEAFRAYVRQAQRARADAARPR